MKFDNNIFAFQSYDNSELNCINSDIPLEKLANHKNFGNETKCPKLSSKDIDKKISNDNNCKYYTINTILLPQIIQPTRITDTTATIVDNIFTNNMNNKILSGNIITGFLIIILNL